MLPTASSSPGSLATSRLRIPSVDVYRGLVMFLMLAEVLRTCDVSASLSGSGWWRFMCLEQTHAAWVGCSLHDLIQPGFYFLVGAGIFLSISRRQALGQTYRTLTAHAAARSLVLILLGMILVSAHPRQWVWSFVDTLTQIGLAYPFVFLIALRPPSHWYVALAGILVGYWLWFAVSPLPGADFDYAQVGVSQAWLDIHGLQGFAAHWQKNANVAAAFDRWFINLFPLEAPHNGYSSGLTTLNFIPSIATMIIGLMAARFLRDATSARTRLVGLSSVGLLLAGVGWTLGVLGICPVVKAIWTPSWVLFSAGWCLLVLAAISALVDGGGITAVVFPFRVIGANSIVAYAISHLYPAFAFNGIRRVVGNAPFDVFGQAYNPFVYGCAVMFLYWVLLFVLYQRRVFVRI
jgi:predicted acyltransferase